MTTRQEPEAEQAEFRRKVKETFANNPRYWVVDLKGAPEECEWCRGWDEVYACAHCGRSDAPKTKP